MSNSCSYQMFSSSFLSDLFTKNRQKELIYSGGSTYTFEEAYSRAYSIVNELGLTKGDIFVLARNNDEVCLFSYIAAMISGSIVVPVNPELSEEAKNYIHQISNPKVVIDDEYNLGEVSNSKIESFSFLSEPDAPFAIFFTSGTTGNPKGVVHCLRAMVENVVSFNDMTGIDQTSNMYHVFPMTYMAGFLNCFLSPMIAGGAITIGERFTPMFALRFWKQAIESQVNCVWLSPTMVELVAKLSRDKETLDWVTANISQCFVGTGALNQDIRSRFETKFKVKCLQSYGMSEILIVSCQTEKSHYSTVGQLIDSTELKLINGELHISSPFLLLDYFNTTLDFVDIEKKRFFKTGDLAELSGDELLITGRADDLIIKGGENISPAAVENLYSGLSYIEDLAVVGFPHDVYGNDIALFVVCNSLNDIELQKTLLEYCRESVDKKYFPGKIICLPEIPRNTNGKVLRNKLKTML